ncbi:hypothetical protein [Streptomyces gobiensis]|uniref:hypothetical protein n=1 Tax=Streptomyces gobiensis TaxID=2875706 RepID=UPI001E499C64|nr:hypothetical protein [Streptomyces gobiensis]UGY93738.1 hypothetical protein test1122_19805 [Streptomyces gobiensis]
MHRNMTASAALAAALAGALVLGPAVAAGAATSAERSLRAAAHASLLSADATGRQAELMDSARDIRSATMALLSEVVRAKEDGRTPDVTKHVRAVKKELRHIEAVTDPMGKFDESTAEVEAMLDTLDKLDKQSKGVSAGAQPNDLLDELVSTLGNVLKSLLDALQGLGDGANLPQPNSGDSPQRPDRPNLPTDGLPELDLSDLDLPELPS